MRMILVPDDHGGEPEEVEVDGVNVRDQICEVLGGVFDPIVTVSLLDAVGMADVTDYRVIPALLVRRDRDALPLPHNARISDAYLPEDHLRGPVLLAGIDQRAQTDDEMFREPPALVADRWKAER